MSISILIPALALLGGDDSADEVVVPKTEEEVYTLETIPLPDGCVLEVGGMDFFSDGRLAVSTRRGQVWIVENPLADDLGEIQVKLFHEGLWEGLGLDIVDDELYVLQRGELSKLQDSDGDGRCDTITTVARDWGVSGHYHEFAFGLPRDKNGDWWIGLNVSFGDPEWWHGRSTVPYRGWILRVAPDGTVTPWASGVRSPNGIALDSKERLFVTDNQGDWVASSPIYQIRKGGFYGHPKPLNWTESYRTAGRLAHDEIPPPEAALERESPAIWIPYQWSRSTGNLFEDTSGGKFGVTNGQFVVAELTNGMILRAGFEEVQGQTQGWVLPLRQKIGSVNRVLQASDGTVFCGLTNRGWGGLAPADGLVRVRWTGAKALEYESMRIVDAEGEEGAFGFELTFSQPLVADWTPTAENVRMVRYDYDYWWEYGSPERHMTEVEFESLELSEDRTKLVVRSFDVLPATCVRLTVDGATSEAGAPLMHDTISYTINQLPSGARSNAYVAKVVPPPPSKGNVDAGVLRLSWGDATAQFAFEGWELVTAELSEDGASFVTSPGTGALVNTGEAPSDYATKGSFGDAQVHFECMLAKGAATALELPGMGRIEFADDKARFGSIGDGGLASEVYTGAGAWHEVDVAYRMGSPDAPATIDRVVVNGVTVQEGVALAGVTGERGPLCFVGSKGPVALRNIQVKPLDRPMDEGEWTFLDPASTWDDWDLAGDCDFELSGDELVGTGARGYLWSPLEEVGDVTVRARVQVNANGAGALVLHARESETGEILGEAVRINASFADGMLTGSIDAGEAKAAVATELIAADTWIDLEVDVRGTRVTVALNGVLVNSLELPVPPDPGGIALRCDHDGTVLKVQNLRIR